MVFKSTRKYKISKRCRQKGIHKSDAFCAEVRIRTEHDQSDSFICPVGFEYFKTRAPLVTGKMFVLRIVRKCTLVIYRSGVLYHQKPAQTVCVGQRGLTNIYECTKNLTNVINRDKIYPTKPYGSPTTPKV